MATTVDYRRKNLRVCSDHFTRECFMTDARRRLTWFAVPTVFSSHTPKVKQVPKPISEPSPTLPEVKLEVNPSLQLPVTAPTPTSEPIPAAAPSNHSTGALAKLRSAIEHNYSDTRAPKENNTRASTEDTRKDRLLNCVVSELVRLQGQRVPKPQKPRRLHTARDIAEAARSLGMSSTCCGFFLGQLKNCRPSEKGSVKRSAVNSETHFWREAVLQQMDEHRQNKTLCDTVIFSKDGRGFSAHSCLLAAASPVMVTELRKQKHPYRVHLVDVHSSQLELVLQFIYTGTIPPEALSEHADRLALAAKTLEITPLRILAEEFMSNTSAAEGYGRQEAVTERCVRRQCNQSNLEPTVYMDNKEDNTNECATENVQNDSRSNSEAQSDGESEGYGNLVITIDGNGFANSTNLVVDSSVISAEINPVTEHQHPKEKDGEAHWSSDSPVAPVSNTDGASVSPDDTHNALVICTDSKEAKKPLKCPHCCKRFKLMKFLMRHQHWHTGARPYLCPLCGKSFARTNALKTHEQTHTRERPHRCLVCGKTFGFARYLRVHELIHGNKTFICSICGKGFTSSARLKVHSVVHTGEMPFVCSWCGRRFRHATAHTNHLRLHTGERPYLCTVCGKQFRSTAGLNVHQQTHTAHRPFSCSVCGLKVRTSMNLKKHQEREHDGEGEKPFKCDACGETFSLSVQRMFHMKRYHRTTQVVASVDTPDNVPEGGSKNSASAVPTAGTTLNVEEESKIQKAVT